MSLRSTIVVALVLLGCPSSRELPVGDAAVDVMRPPDTGTEPLPPGTDLDVLFVVDNSGSMNEEQTSFAWQLPRFVREVGARYRSTHIGFVDTDMGSGSFSVPTCTESNFGDDGILRTTGNTTIAGCEATYPTFLDYRPSTDDAVAVGEDAVCLGVMGTGGCGLEQHLEAMLKALTPSTQGATRRFDGTFFMGTRGHADGANSGFLRPDADLLVVILSDEEDCSALDPELFNPTSAVYSGDLNLRCFSFPGAVQPVERYTDGLLASRDPRRVHYVVIAGVPTEVAGDDYETILAHPDMEERIDPDMTTRLRPSCNVAGRGFAFPPRRMVELGRQLDDRGVRVSIQSICHADFSPAFDAIDAVLR